MVQRNIETFPPMTEAEKAEPKPKKTSPKGISESERQKEFAAENLGKAVVEDTSEIRKGLAGDYEGLIRGLSGYRAKKLEKQLNLLSLLNDVTDVSKKISDNIKTLDENYLQNVAANKEAAKDIIDKEPVSRTALDALIARGPSQMEMPEAPSLGNFATQMLVGAIGNMFQIFNEDELSSAESEHAGPITAERASAYMAAQFASFEQNRQRVLEINAQLRAKYQDDIISYMADFDRRADEAEKNYQRALLDVAFKRTAQSLELFFKRADIDMEIAKLKADIGMKEKTYEVEKEKFNVEAENRQRQFNAEMRNRLQSALASSVLNQIQSYDKLKENLRKQNIEKFGTNIISGSSAMNSMSSNSGSYYKNFAIDGVNNLNYDTNDPTTGGLNSAQLSMRQARASTNLRNAVRIYKYNPSDPNSESNKKMSNYIANLQYFHGRQLLPNKFTDRQIELLGKNLYTTGTMNLGGEKEVLDGFSDIHQTLKRTYKPGGGVVEKTIPDASPLQIEAQAELNAFDALIQNYKAQKEFSGEAIQIEGE